MLPLLSIAIVIILGIHGLIHLMGFVAYWPLKEMPQLAYKTVFLDGRLELGANRTRIYSVLWLLTAIGFVAAAIALIAGWGWGQPLLLAVTLLSLVITALDWTPAFRGAVIDPVILVLLLMGPQLARILPQIGS
ncbi:MAG: ABC transporter permease [Anaerolineae bacterium]|nr:ABC transporter permease [Anaerolineae bacterium]